MSANVPSSYDDAPRIDPERVLKRADEITYLQDRWAADPSTDTAMSAVVKALCEAINEVLKAYQPLPEPGYRFSVEREDGE